MHSRRAARDPIAALDHEHLRSCLDRSVRDHRTTESTADDHQIPFI
jgi:hypothetical protein